MPNNLYVLLVYATQDQEDKCEEKHKDKQQSPRKSEEVVKREHHPEVSAPVTKVAQPVKGKESRREELLKQLKAVEDAIAKKKSKVG